MTYAIVELITKWPDIIGTSIINIKKVVEEILNTRNIIRDEAMKKRLSRFSTLMEKAKFEPDGVRLSLQKFIENPSEKTWDLLQESLTKMDSVQADLLHFFDSAPDYWKALNIEFTDTAKSIRGQKAALSRSFRGDFYRLNYDEIKEIRRLMEDLIIKFDSINKQIFSLQLDIKKALVGEKA